MWKHTPEEAYKKTVLRRLTKKVEKDFVSVEQAKAYEESSDTEFKKEEPAKRKDVPDILYKQEDTIDAEFTAVIDQELSQYNASEVMK